MYLLYEHLTVLITIDRRKIVIAQGSLKNGEMRRMVWEGGDSWWTHMAPAPRGREGFG